MLGTIWGGQGIDRGVTNLVACRRQRQGVEFDDWARLYTERDPGRVRSLLIVHHTPSPATHVMFDAVHSGATDARITGIQVIARPALAATAIDVLGADGYVLGTPANLGYISGALKHFFDQIYYPCLDATTGRPYGLYVHGNNDTGGAAKAVEIITTGLQWRAAQRPVFVVGEPSREDLEACWELGAGVSAMVAEGLA